MNPRSSYFEDLDRALKEAGIGVPVLIIDMDRLDANVDVVRRQVGGGRGIRLVDKSLPVLPLIGHLMARLETRRVMSFHLPTAQAVLARFPDCEILFGKPIPVRALHHMLATASPDQRIEFCRRTVLLVDSVRRLAAYADEAGTFDLTFRFAFEVDVGLHRGGFSDPAALEAALRGIEGNGRMKCEGLMGYEPHIAKIPAPFGGPVGERARVARRFNAFVEAIPPASRTILNTAGSNTALGHGPAISANELSMGSGFLLPTDFDGGELAALSPAVFIAAPVLKIVDGKIPGPAFLTEAMRRLGRLPARGCFIYGGKWMAQPVFPPGLRENPLWGTSSNQQFFELGAASTVAEDDFVFLRPTQSEAVLQQFGPIAIYRGGRIDDWWQPLPTG